MIGSSSVGKCTLLSRLLSIDFEDASDSSSEVVVHGDVDHGSFSPNRLLKIFSRHFCVGMNRWTINSKYYTADVSVWMAHLHDGFSIGTLPIFNQLAALVMVFD
ncbi:Ras-related protein Rab-11A, partial [Quillaja saponaria]